MSARYLTTEIQRIKVDPSHRNRLPLGKQIMRVSLRSKILVAILTAVVVSDGIAIWVVHDRLRDGARQEAQQQAQARTEQVQALYRERTATLAAEGEAVS